MNTDQHQAIITALDHILDTVMIRAAGTDKGIASLFVSMRDQANERGQLTERRIVDALNALAKEQDALRAQVIGRFTDNHSQANPFKPLDPTALLLVLKSLANRTLTESSDHRAALETHTDAIRDLTAQHVATRYCLAHMVLAIEANNERLESIETLLLQSDHSPAAGEPVIPTGA